VAHAGFLYLEAFIEPFGTLWFIYLLRCSSSSQGNAANAAAGDLGVAALLEMTHIATGWTVIDDFGARFGLFLFRLLVCGPVFASPTRTGAACAGARGLRSGRSSTRLVVSGSANGR